VAKGAVRLNLPVNKGRGGLA